MARQPAFEDDEEEPREPEQYSPEDEIKIEHASEVTFSRLQTLIDKGYKPDFDVHDRLLFRGHSILLEHPTRNFEHRGITLYCYGRVKSHRDTDGTYLFERWEQDRFNSFLWKVPTPSSWDKARSRVENMTTGLVAVLIWVAIFAFFYWLQQP